MSCSEPVQIGNFQSELANPRISEVKASQEAFHKQKIQLIGYFHYSFENVAVYEFEWSDKDNAVWFDYPAEFDSLLTDDVLESLSGSRVLVQGTFDANDKGHLGMFVGTVDISYIEKL